MSRIVDPDRIIAQLREEIDYLEGVIEEMQDKISKLETEATKAEQGPNFDLPQCGYCGDFYNEHSWCH